MVPTRPGPTSAGVLYHVYSASLCLGWMHDSPWKSTESSLFLKTKGQCLVSAEAKVNQVDPSNSKNAGTGKDFKILEYQYSNQNRDKVWRRQGKKEHTHLCSLAFSSSLACSLRLDTANGSFPLTYSPVPQPHLCQPLYPQPGAH